MNGMDNSQRGAEQYGDMSDVNARISDLEERQRILRDRVLITGKNLVEEREKTFNDVQEIKKIVLKLKEDTLLMKETLQNITERVNESARKEDFAILQRQLDLLRKDRGNENES